MVFDDALLIRLLKLFSLKRKREVEKYVRDLVIQSKEFAALVLAARAGGLPPYRHMAHFAEGMPKDLWPSAKQLEGLASNGVGELSPIARKAVGKMFQITRERGLFAAHLFYVESGRYWHVLYFDQRDIADSDNHWRNGAHVHYSNETFVRESLAVVWSRIATDNPIPPKSVHIRYDHHRNTISAASGS